MADNLCHEILKDEVIDRMVNSLKSTPMYKSDVFYLMKPLQAHVTFSLEFLGASLFMSLSEKNLQIMEYTLNIYKKWLLLNCSKDWPIVIPPIFTKRPQFLYQEIIKQMSGIFEKRIVPSNEQL